MKIYRAKNYSKEEVEESLNYLNKYLDEQLDVRTEATKKINKIRKDIKFWESIDKRQLKMF